MLVYCLLVCVFFTCLSLLILCVAPVCRRSVHKTHVQLAKHVRIFDGCLQQLTETTLGPSQQQMQQQLVAVALALPLRSPLVVGRKVADAQQQQQGFEVKCNNGSEMDASAAAGAAAARKSVQEFLRLSLGLGGTIEAPEASLLSDLHAFSGRSTSAAEVALEVQAFCRDFTATIKEAAAAAARATEQQQQEEAEACPEAPKKKKTVSRQQMQRRFADLRFLLRSTLKLPCLSMCGGSPALFAAALNDCSGLPTVSASSHPLLQATALQQHDTARAAAAALAARKEAQKKPLQGSEGAAAVMPLGTLLGDVWSSAAQQWYLLLNLLVQCQQVSSPHRDVAADRDALLGFTASLVLHGLQQRSRCWQAAAAYQKLVDVAAICLVSGSVRVPVETAADLAAAAEVLEEGLKQARALLPSAHEATVQNEALNIADVLPLESVAATAPATSTAAFTDPEGSLISPVKAPQQQPDERQLLQHNVRQLHEARSSIATALRALQRLQQLVLMTPEASQLNARRGSSSKGREELRVRLQWVEEAEGACSATLAALQGEGNRLAGLLQLLPSHAAAGLQSACKALDWSCSSLTAAAAGAKAATKGSASGTQGLLAFALRTLTEAVGKTSSSKEQQQHARRDNLLQLSALCAAVEDGEVEQQQPAFDALPLPPLNEVFAYEEAIAALNAFDRVAPAYIEGGLLEPPGLSSPDACSSKASAAVLQMLQRATGVLLAAFDGLEGTVRLGLSVLQLISVLFELGWGCLSSEEEDAAAAAQQEHKQKDSWVSGTGLGEGEGACDASEKIEEEWQFDGLKDERSDSNKQPPEKPKTQEEVNTPRPQLPERAVHAPVATQSPLKGAATVGSSVYTHWQPLLPLLLRMRVEVTTVGR